MNIKKIFYLVLFCISSLCALTVYEHSLPTLEVPEYSSLSVHTADGTFIPVPTEDAVKIVALVRNRLLYRDNHSFSYSDDVFFMLNYDNESVALYPALDGSSNLVIPSLNAYIYIKEPQFFELGVLLHHYGLRIPSIHS